MNLNDIRAELVTKTERKIQEMKARSIILPERRADMCELCDQLSQEIYDFAVNTAFQIADRNHLRGRVANLLDELHEDIYALTNGALDIIVSASTRGPGASHTQEQQPTGKKRRIFRTPPKFFQLVYSWFKGLRSQDFLDLLKVKRPSDSVTTCKLSS
ncbi:hypothetical protein SAMN04487996_10135 [Dyadobacter soli]|uniref:Uncharacterized protein n=1 Tax=Dyadobacter soli TaxID=659014 RepID=A0A1G6USS2_9BACT|nr:hypothetical protein [Dyadobacter soli]SDD43595.1 hypothetical protein SAMN04487996_10135 [Dyadobacter soli]